MVRPAEATAEDAWIHSRALYAKATSVPCDLGLMDTVRNAPWPCRAVLYRKPAKGRKHRTLGGEVVRSKTSPKSAQRERDPWLLVASPTLHDLSARQLVTLHQRRMQIELSFRDLKSHRYGQGFEDSLTRCGTRIEILLLVNALAFFASWLAGLASEAIGIAKWLSPASANCNRRLYSILRIGREALVRG